MAHPALFSPARRERDVGRRAPLLLAIAVCLASAAPAEAQLVEGRVLDAGSGEAVATARVSLLDESGDRLGTVLSGEDGWFLFRPDGPGMYVLEADRLGYGVQRTDPFVVTADEITRRDFPLTTRAVEVEGVTVEGYPGRLMHDATLSGVYARRARSPSVGPTRVLVRGDAELDEQHRVSDVLRGRIPRPQCPRRGSDGQPLPFMFWDGADSEVLGPGAEEFILDLPIREVEAIEFYRDIAQVPMSIRPNEWSNHILRACGVVGVWSRGAPR